MLFQCLLNKVIRHGTLRMITAGGNVHTFGDGHDPAIIIKLHNKKLEWTMGLQPEVKIGEAYIDGTLTIEKGDLYGFLQLLLANAKLSGKRSFFDWIEHHYRYFVWLENLNTTWRARHNVAFHYDMPDELYRFFLDEDRQYSCGYFTDLHNSLDEAQLDKKMHIASKLLLDKPGLRVLDIGSGWGGMGLYLAREAACQVQGVTLSVNQQKISKERAEKEGLHNQCHFALRDYRHEKGSYDRIVSVGMFEHVGRKNYDEFFQNIHRLLADDGVCLLHTIGWVGHPRPVSPFIRKHIFPGTALPSLPELLEHAERAGLFVTDVEVLRFHYAETLRRWRRRLQSHHNEVIKLFGQQLYKKWLFYFTGCELAFRLGTLNIYQVQLSKRFETVPITRDYMYEWEQMQRQSQDDFIQAAQQRHTPLS